MDSLTLPLPAPFVNDISGLLFFTSTPAFADSDDVAAEGRDEAAGCELADAGGVTVEAVALVHPEPNFNLILKALIVLDRAPGVERPTDI